MAKHKENRIRCDGCVYVYIRYDSRTKETTDPHCDLLHECVKDGIHPDCPKRRKNWIQKTSP